MRGLPTSEGVYRYVKESDKWQLLAQFTVEDLVEGCNFVYFRNIMCLPCRLFDLKFPDVVSAYSCRCTFTVVTCGFYKRLCLSGAASRAFAAFGVTEGPTLYVAIVREGRPEREAVIVGNPSISELRSYLYKTLGIRACRSTPPSH